MTTQTIGRPKGKEIDVSKLKMSLSRRAEELGYSSTKNLLTAYSDKIRYLSIFYVFRTSRITDSMICKLEDIGIDSKDYLI